MEKNNNQNNLNARSYWIDNVKIFACFFVVIGHFIQSMVKAGFVAETNSFLWFNSAIYNFHVMLFFVASGYIYQKYSNVTTPKLWVENIFKKSLSLLVPYFTFNTLNFLLKNLFSSAVNNQEDSLLQSLFIVPSAPFWFLLALFMLFLVTPTLKSKKGGIILLSVGVLLFFLYPLVGQFDFLFKYYIQYVMRYLFLFAIGMNIQLFSETRVLKPYLSLLILVFIILKTITYKDVNFEIRNSLLYFTLIITSTIPILVIIYHISKNLKFYKVTNFLSKYTMSIFLLHTIFAAGIRTLLLKIDVENWLVHIVIGLVASFVFPIFSQIIMEKLRLDFFITPTKYIKIKIKTEKQ